MPDALSTLGPWIAYAVMLVVVVAGLFLNILGLPGLWLIVVGAIAYAWGFGFELIGKWSLLAIFGLAVLAEIVEFVAGAAGSKQAGGSKRGMAGAIVGGLVGGIVGTGLIPIPVVGTIVGSVLGTFAGAYVVEFGIGREHGEAMWISYGAAKGRVWGMVWKSVFGVMMGVVVAVMGVPLKSRRSPPAPAAPLSPTTSIVASL